MKNDVVIDGKGYIFGTKKVKIGGIEYEIPQNEYPLDFIVSKSDMMIMLKNHCDIPLIQRKTNPKTGEHIAKISVDFHGGWTEQVRRLCDQMNTRTIIFIAEKPESDQPEIPFEDESQCRKWILDDEYLTMCFRHNADMIIYKVYQVIESPDRNIDSIQVAVTEEEPYERTVYDSDKVNEYTLPKTDEAASQAHYDALRKSNNPNAVIPEPEKKIEPKLKDFAKSLEPKEVEKVVAAFTKNEMSDNPDVAVRKVVYKEKEIVPEEPKAAPISEGKKSYKKK